MEKKTQIPKKPESEPENKIPMEEKQEEEFDADSEVHKTSPDLIQKEDHHLPVDDEIKKG